MPEWHKTCYGVNKHTLLIQCMGLLDKSGNTFMNHFKSALLAVAGLVLAGSASATVVTSLPGGAALVIPATDQLSFFGPATVVPGVTYSSNQPSAYGYTGGYGFSSNGSWNGTPMIGLDRGTGTFELAFAAPITGFLGELNWTVGAGGNASISIYNSMGTLLESLTLENGANVVAPGYYGFSRSIADISFVRFNEEYIGVRNITTTGFGAAVPEPASWAMLIAGFGLTGAAMRRRRSVAVAA